VAGKSAQFPLHTWLPDAMEGPTPVSALIHAATMVAAGVYLVARLLPLFLAAPVALAAAAVIAAVTMLGAALAAVAQEDLKRLLAWSTISQVAYMLGGVAVARAANGAAPAVLHLLSHAAFKALLFLAAGCVVHLVGSTLLRDMGGLRRTDPCSPDCSRSGWRPWRACRRCPASGRRRPCSPPPRAPWTPSAGRPGSSWPAAC
jgi:NADH-quinone oxidoreductase subunit L